MKKLSLCMTGSVTALSLFFAANVGAASYDFSTFSAESQSYEGVTVGEMLLTSEAGDLHYTNSYGGGIFAGSGGASDVYISFSTALNGISIRAGDGSGDADAFGFSAYEFGTGTLLGSWYSPVFGGSNEPEWYTLNILASNIGSIVFDPCNSGVCPGILGVIGGVVITDIITSPVPEPEAYAMLLAGLGLLGFMARRRKESAV